MLAVDLRGTIIASWAAAELMRRAGRRHRQHVLGSRGFGMAGENPILYSAAKGGIMSFSKSFARAGGAADPGEHPGAGLHRDRLRRAGRRALAARRSRRGRPLGRWGAPEDVAGAAVFLVSGRVGFLTGQMIMVNGGVVM